MSFERRAAIGTRDRIRFNSLVTTRTIGHINQYRSISAEVEWRVSTHNSYANKIARNRYEFYVPIVNQARKTSATVQACAKHPFGIIGASPSKISLRLPNP